MPRESSPQEYRKKSTDDLLVELKRLREELQQIRFAKVSGTGVAKLSKIKTLRRQIARVLTIVRENRKQAVLAAPRKSQVEQVVGDKVQTVETTIKNLKFKKLPFDLRPKRTRAIRRRLTKFEAKLVTLKQLKRRLNFPKRKFAVPLL